MTGAQLPLPAGACPRCRCALVSPFELGRLAFDLEDAVQRAVRAFATMKLAIPSSFTVALRDAERLAPDLARAIACHAGRCRQGVT